MSDATLLVVLLLWAVLVWSGVGKLRSGRPDAAFDALQVPEPLASAPIRRGLPWFEILLALVLLIGPRGLAQVAVTVVTLVLFLAYLWLIARTLAAHASVSCNCFGSSTIAVTRWTLIRNILLVAAAAVAVGRAAAGSESPIARLIALPGPGWVALLSGVGVAATVGVLVRAERPPEAPITGAPPATPETSGGEADYERRPTPWVALESLDGTYRLLRDLTSASAQLVLFLSPSCQSCRAVWSLVPEWAERLAPVGVLIAARDRPSGGSMPSHLAEYVWIDHQWAMLKAVGGYGTPSAVLLGADGLLAGGPVGGADEVQEFVRGIIEQLEEASALSTPANTGPDKQ